MPLHYLTDEEELAIKRTIPWDSIDSEIRGLIQLANEVEGIATLQSCAGHVHLLENSNFSIHSAHVTFRATQKRMMQILFNTAPMQGIMDINLRFFDDGTFWIRIEAEPSERWRLYNLFRELQE